MILGIWEEVDKGENFVDMRLNRDFLGWTEPCPWHVRYRLPCQAELGKKSRKYWLLPAVGQWTHATSFNLFIWARCLNILTDFIFTFLSFLQWTHRWLPVRRRAAYPFFLCYQNSMKAFLMHCMKACTTSICLGTTEFWASFLQYIIVSIRQSQCRGQCSGCLWEKVQVKKNHPVVLFLFR